jgi:hypothetical protein
MDRVGVDVEVEVDVDVEVEVEAQFYTGRSNSFIMLTLSL